jgi:BirA family biotin operon repressor/biotin-[acetyl-CoA-carboxylase] ligase
LGAVLDALAHWLVRGVDEMLAAWRARDALQGSHVRWAEGAGVAAGIDDQGSLLVDTDRGRVTLGAGEVHLKR